MSGETALAATRVLRFLESGGAAAQKFLRALQEFTEVCDGDPAECPCCDDVCLASQVNELAPGSRKAEKKE